MRPRFPAAAGPCLLPTVLLAACAAPSPGGRDDEDRPPPGPALSAEAIPLQVDSVPARPRPVLELGDPFFGVGPLRRGVVAPTGQVLQPSFLLFGVLRTALQTFDRGDGTTTEWASRLDLFGNLQLSGTERVLLGFRPLDEDGDFSGYVFEDGDEGWQDELNAEVTTFFFEGELGELFPGLDRDDSRPIDLGIAVGRQPLVFQDGLLIDDTIDSIGITRNTLRPPGFANLRATLLFGWNDIHRDDNREDADSLLYGLFLEGDVHEHTVSFDTVFVDDDDDDTDALYFGAGSVQELGRYDTTFRGIASIPSEGDTPEVGGGVLLFGEVSRTYGRDNDLVYLDGFWGIDEPSSAARGPSTGGPLGRTGLLFSSVQLGSYGAALGNRADDSVGAALGWQSFLGDDEHLRQLVLEAGGRVGTDGTGGDAIATGLRYEQALSRLLLVRLDGFVAGIEDEPPSAGMRVELQLEF